MARKPMAAREDDAEMRKYRAEDDIRTLSRAKEIEADAARMREVKRHAKRQADVLAKIHSPPRKG